MEIPKKFQNEDGTLNSEILLKSYSELEKKIGSMINVPTTTDDETTREKFNRALGIPESECDYPIHPVFDDENIRKKFLDAGLNSAQVEKYMKSQMIFLHQCWGIFFNRDTNQIQSMIYKSFLVTKIK